MVVYLVAGPPYPGPYSVGFVTRVLFRVLYLPLPSASVLPFRSFRVPETGYVFICESDVKQTTRPSNVFLFR